MTEQTVEKATIPRLRLGETGFTGLKNIGGRIQEEARRELRFPEANRTFRTMAQDATIAAALSLFEMMMARVEWTVDLGVAPDDAMKARGAFLQECLDDMDHTWRSFIQEVTSVMTYGYCVNEKVYRRRTHENGSRYNDNKIGIKKLPVRSQDTIHKWLYDDEGRELKGVQQSLALVSGGGDRYLNLNSATSTGFVDIPRKKFLLFRVDAKRDNPEGNSPLRGCYNAWKYRTLIEEQEAVNPSGTWKRFYVKASVVNLPKPI